MGSAPKTFAIAFGGGGARGLAQIAVVEALDELGIRPTAIAGASIGALIGAAYAAGMSGKAMRRHAIQIAHNRGETLARLMGARIGRLADLLPSVLGNPMLLDAEKFCAAFLPQAIPDTFEELTIPTTIAITDLHGRAESALSSGPLKSAIAASLAIPGLFRPVEIDGRICVDGAAVNPLPFDHLLGRADVVIAVDSSAGPLDATAVPDPWDSLFATITVMGHIITEAKLKQREPDLLLRPRADIFRLLDFLQASAILRAAGPIKAEVKANLVPLLGLQ